MSGEKLRAALYECFDDEAFMTAHLNARSLADAVMADPGVQAALAAPSTPEPPRCLRCGETWEFHDPEGEACRDGQGLWNPAPSTPEPNEHDLCGHRTRDEHDCFAMRCRGLGYEVEQLREALRAAPSTEPALDAITVNGHLYVHVAACPCPAMQAEVARLAESQR